MPLRASSSVGRRLVFVAGVVALGAGAAWGLRRSASPPKTVDVPSAPPKPGRSAIPAAPILSSAPAAAVLVGVVRDELGQPKAGAIVRFLPVSATASGWIHDTRLFLGQRAPDAGEDFAERLRSEPATTTDAQGHFRLDVGSTAPGVLVAAAPGYRGATHRVTQASLQQRSEGPAETPRIALVLSTGGRIVGVVRDRASGGPVAGAQVKVVLTPKVRDQTPMSGTLAGADDDGRFELVGLPEGTYRARALTGRSQHLPHEASEAVEVSVRGDAPANIELRVERGAELVVHVVSDGQPVSGAKCIVVPLDARGERLSGTAPGALAYSDGYGRCSATMLDARRKHVVTVTAAGYAFVMQAVAPFAADSDQGQVTVELERGGTLRGRVVQTDGAPAPPMYIAVRPLEVPETPQGAGRLYSRRGARSDADGGFQLDGLPNGPAMVTVRDTKTSGRFDKDQRVWNVSIGPNNEDLTTELEVSELRGTVVDEAQNPVGDAKVTLRPTKRSRTTFRKLSAQSDNDGRFVFRSCQDLAGVELAVEASGYVDATVPVEDPTALVQIELIRAAVVRGRVVADPPSQDSLAGMVSARPLAPLVSPSSRRIRADSARRYL